MSRTNVITVGLIASLYYSVPAASADGVLKTRRQQSLVRATVTKVLDSGQDVVGVLVVDHVFVGKSDIVQKEFTAKSTRNNSMTHGLEIYPPLKEGEVGLWLVWEDSQRKMVSSRVFMFETFWPVRKDIDANYAGSLALAKAIEGVASADAAGRDAMLRRLAESDNVAICRYAIHALELAKPEGYLQFLRSVLAKKGLSVYGQIAADEVLSSVERGEWWHAAERLAVLARWATSELTEDEAASVIDRLDVSVQQKQIVPGEAVELARRMLNNGKWPISEREKTVRWIGRMAGTEEGKDRAIDLLMSLVRQSGNNRIVVAAARILSGIVLTDQQMQAVKDLGDRSQDPEVREILREVSARGKGHDNQAESKPVERER